jgi:hypothetical protein
MLKATTQNLKLLKLDDMNLLMKDAQMLRKQELLDGATSNTFLEKLLL